MIIKMSLCRDSDLIRYIVDFLEDREFFSDVNVSLCLTGALFSTWNMPRYSDEDWKAYKEKEALHKRILDVYAPRYKKGSKEYAMICEEVKSLWKQWCEKREPVKDLSEDLDVSIQYSVTEHDGNGEELYYFSRTDQWIVM